MLTAISWHQYFATVLLLSLAWYAAIAFRYYRTEIAALLKIKPASARQPLLESSAPVMGAAKPETGTAVHDPEELVFGRSEPDDLNDATVPRGPADELLAETQTLVAAFEETGNKKDFLSLLGLLLDKYEPYRDEIDLQILRPLAAQLPFAIADDEWPVF